MSIIGDHMNRSLLWAKAQAHDRNEAIRMAGGLLEKNGLATSEYTEAMIENLDENGPYIVIAPGIAMPHARPGKGALRMGVSLVTLEKPIPFAHATNDPVEIVIGLCAVDHEGHLELLSEVVSMLGDESIKNRLIQAENEQQMLEIIERSGSND